jgi:hypothetical protein
MTEGEEQRIKNQALFDTLFNGQSKEISELANGNAFLEP